VAVPGTEKLLKKRAVATLSLAMVTAAVRQ
jgi:hypothetical protein